jgi:DNA-binding transcriptional ArsR family regulator
MSEMNIAAIGALVGDQARVRMLTTLFDGRALTATELAAAAGVTPATASSHLSKLTKGGLLTGVSQGRLDSDTLLVRWNDKHDGRW